MLLTFLVYLPIGLIKRLFSKKILHKHDLKFLKTKSNFRLEEIQLYKSFLGGVGKLFLFFLSLLYVLYCSCVKEQSLDWLTNKITGNL